MTHRVILSQDEDGMYVAECLDLPGCISQSSTRKEAMKNIKDAIKGYLESLKTHGEKPSVRKNIKVLKVDV
ncbi:MAG: type II toxin-antitoxin system HicB family antitoxin [Nitrososphaerales archaeon]